VSDGWSPFLRSYFAHWYTCGYAYNQAGRVVTQTAAVQIADTGNSFYQSVQPVSPAIVTLTTTYQYDTEGRMTSMAPSLSLPTSWPSSATFPTMGYQYDANGRLSTLTANGSTMATATYNPAGQISTLTWGPWGETDTYNSLNQLISQYVPNAFNTAYTYSPTQNNGRIVGSMDDATGESASYTYDALNRLTAVSNSQWSQCRWW